MRVQAEDRHSSQEGGSAKKGDAERVGAGVGVVVLGVVVVVGRAPEIWVEKIRIVGGVVGVQGAVEEGVAAEVL